MRRLAGSVVAVVLAAATAALAAAGALDPSFDGDGKRILSELDTVNDVAVQPDGRIVLVGYAVGPGGADVDFKIVRLNPDGSPDPAFDGDGVANVPLSGDDYAEGVTLQPDGRIVVVGSTSVATRAAIIRLTTAGALDPSFDGDGKLAFDFGGDDEFDDVLVQPDGKIVPVGTGNAAGDFAVMRLDSNGTPDPGFDGDGLVGVNLGGTEDIANAVARQPDGKIVAAGFAAGDPAVIRLDTAGQLDNSFDGDGKRAIGDPAIASAEDMLLQPDGKVVLAGYGNADLAVARLDSTGALDPGFAGDGIASVDFGALETGYAATLDPAGRITIAGRTSAGNDLTVARLDLTGTLDPGFGAGGGTTVDLGASDVPEAAALQPDGAMVVAGHSSIKGFAVRLLGDPAPDPGGGGDGGGGDGGGSGDGGGGGGGGASELTRTLTLRYSSRPETFKGSLISTEPTCTSAKVKVFEKRRGDDPKVGADRTNAAGRWAVRERGANGRFYATTGAVATAAGTCPAAKSDLKKVG